MVLFYCISGHCNIIFTSKNTCCTCKCHWSGERTSLLVLEHSCFRRSKLFRRFEICAQKIFFFRKQDVFWCSERRRRGGEKVLSTFFRALIFRVGSLPADASVWLDLTEDVCNRHQGNGLTLLQTHSKHIWTEFLPSCIGVKGKKILLVALATRNFSKTCIAKQCIVSTKCSVWVLCWNCTSDSLEISVCRRILRWNHHHHFMAPRL